MIDCYVTEMHPHYQVWVEGKVVDEMTAQWGHPLTSSQMTDIALGYRDWYETQAAIDAA